MLPTACVWADDLCGLHPVLKDHAIAPVDSVTTGSCVVSHEGDHTPVHPEPQLQGFANALVTLVHQTYLNAWPTWTLNRHKHMSSPRPVGCKSL